LAAGLRLDPLGELKRSPRPPSRNKGGLLLRGGEGRVRRGGEEEGRGKRKGRGNLLKGVRGDRRPYVRIFEKYVGRMHWMHVRPGN